MLAKSSAACVSAAASRLAVGGARDLTTPVVVLGGMVLRLMLSSVRVACSDVASFGCPAICEGAAVTAAFVNVVLAVVACVR